MHLQCADAGSAEVVGDAATGYRYICTRCPHEKLEVRSIAGTVVVCLFGPFGRFWA